MFEDYREVLRVIDPFPPKKEARRQKSVGLTEEEWRKVAKVAKASGQTESEVVRHFVRWSLQELERKEAGVPHPEAVHLLDELVRLGIKEASALRAFAEKNARKRPT